MLLYRYQSKQRDDKSSFTDQSISTLHKSDYSSSDFGHESQLNTNYCLIIKQSNDIHKKVIRIIVILYFYQILV